MSQPSCTLFGSLPIAWHCTVSLDVSAELYAFPQPTNRMALHCMMSQPSCTHFTVLVQFVISVCGIKCCFQNVDGLTHNERVFIKKKNGFISNGRINRSDSRISACVLHDRHSRAQATHYYATYNVTGLNKYCVKNQSYVGYSHA